MSILRLQVNGECKYEYDPVRKLFNINENIAQDWNNITGYKLLYNIIKL